MCKKLLLSILLIPFFTSGQNYYAYVASESEDTVSLIKFDGKEAVEAERIDVGFMFAEIEALTELQLILAEIFGIYH